MVARKLRNHIIEITDSPFYGVESFSFIEIDSDDLASLLMCAEPKNIREVEHGYKISYSTGDAIDSRYKKLAYDKTKAKPKYDLSIRYESTIPGTSMLIRDATKHIIKIARRGNKRMSFGVNVAPIDDETRKRFFESCVRSKRHGLTGSYAIDASDFEEYSYWSKLMNRIFVYNAYAKLKVERK